jgi:LEA14-like dessication related protein
MLSTFAIRRLALTAISAALVSCATVPSIPMQVNVATVERIPGDSMELRFNAKLRIQNPNTEPVEYSGAFVELMLAGKTIGTGVTDSSGLVPRYGEVIVDVPVTVTALGEVRRATGLYGAADRKLDVVLRGKLQGATFSDLGFQWRGEMAMPQPR